MVVAEVVEKGALGEAVEDRAFEGGEVQLDVECVEFLPDRFEGFHCSVVHIVDCRADEDEMF